MLQIGGFQRSGAVTAPLLRFQPQLKLRLGSITDTMAAKRIKRAIHKAIYTGFDEAIEDTIQIGRKIVPESRFRDYPDSYKSQALLKTWIAFMKKESADLSAGQNILRDTYEIEQEWAASYAEFVNEMVHVNWSKPGSKKYFIEKIHRHLVKSILKRVRSNIKSLPAGSAIWSMI